MTSQDGIDQTFLKALAGLAGTGDEFEFERRGTGDSTYCLHGQVAAVDAELGTIQIRRTRTHAGEVHEMGLQYFLSAIHPNGVKFINRVADERNQGFRDRQQARVEAVNAGFGKPGIPSRREGIALDVCRSRPGHA